MAPELLSKNLLKLLNYFPDHCSTEVLPHCCAYCIFTCHHGKYPTFPNHKVPSNTGSWQRNQNCSFCSVRLHICQSLPLCKKPSTSSASYWTASDIMSNVIRNRHLLKRALSLQNITIQDQLLSHSLYKCFQKHSVGAFILTFNKFLVKHKRKTGQKSCSIPSLTLSFSPPSHPDG